MLASLLNTPIAVQASVQVVRAFIRLREMLATHKDLARRLEELEKKYDAQFKVVFDAIRQLMAPPERSRQSIGVRTRDIALPVGSRCRPVGFRQEDRAVRYQVRRGPQHGRRHWMTSSPTPLMNVGEVVEYSVSSVTRRRVFWRNETRFSAPDLSPLERDG